MLMTLCIFYSPTLVLKPFYLCPLHDFAVAFYFRFRLHFEEKDIFTYFMDPQFAFRFIKKISKHYSNNIRPHSAPWLNIVL